VRNGDRQYASSGQPIRLADYIGQTNAKENLRIYIAAARKRREALDHILLTGPAGLGKSTLSQIIANEMGAPLRSTSVEALTKFGDLVALLTNLQDGDFLSIQKMHVLPKNFIEMLYQAMKHFAFEFQTGHGPAARSIKIELPHFTLITTTSWPALIPARLRTLFGINFHFDFYGVEDLTAICKRSASLLNVEIDDRGAHEIARRSRGTPRTLNSLLRRVQDFAEVDYEGRITWEVANDALNRLEVDTYGLTEIDRRLLLTIMEKFDGGPVGLDALSTVIDEQKQSIEENIEPYLTQIGFLNRTPSGRVVTQLAYKHFETLSTQRPPGLFD
jgi:Holliday junction DNA helicase RuvB